MGRLQLTSRTVAFLALLIAGSVAAGPDYGKSYALVVGIDEYRAGGWQPLAYAGAMRRRSPGCCSGKALR